MELPNTALPEGRFTTGRSPSGVETSFTTTTSGNGVNIPFNENFNLSTSNIVVSDINETNELAGNKSFFLSSSCQVTM